RLIEKTWAWKVSCAEARTGARRRPVAVAESVSRPAPGVGSICPAVLAARPDRPTPKGRTPIMQRLLMAAGSILLLTTVAHPHPFATHRPANPASFTLAADDDGGSSDNGDASATEDADEGSSATSDVGVTDNGGGDQGPDAGDARATDDSAGAAPDGAPPGPPLPLTEAAPPGRPPSFATLGVLKGSTVKNIDACSCAR